MIELVFPANQFGALRSELLKDGKERCGVLFTATAIQPDGSVRLLVNDVRFPLETDYTIRTGIRAELKPEFVASVAKRARSEGYGIVFAHSHMTGVARFSDTDDKGERPLAEFLRRRCPEQMNCALLLTAASARARLLGAGEDIPIVSIGNSIGRISNDDETVVQNERFDRQIRAFGRSGQASIQQLRVSVIGLGGTGSIVSQELSHLGVRDFTLIDPDVVEPSNLNRIVNAGEAAVGKRKVDVAAEYISRVNENANVLAIGDTVIREDVARKVTASNFIFACTDSHGSRQVLQQIAYQYLIPCIDVGVVIINDLGRIAHVLGRVQALTPDTACLTCGNLVNPEEVRRDMLSEDDRAADPYILGGGEPAPAVISINGTVSSLAVTMFLAMVTGIPSAARHIYYDALKSLIRVVEVAKNPDCFICSPTGALARGDAWPIFARKN